MKKIIHLYIAREIIVPLFLGLIFFTFVLFIDKIVKLSELFLKPGISLSGIGKIYLLILPTFLSFTLPMALLLGTLVAFSRLAQDGELIAMRTSGISIAKLLPCPLIISTAVFLLTLSMTIIFRPSARYHYNNLLLLTAQRMANISFHEMVFIDDFPGFVIYINKCTSDGLYKGIMIADERYEGSMREKVPSTIIAREGNLFSMPGEMKVVFRLRDGSIYRLGRERSTFQKIDFLNYDLIFDPGSDIAKSTTTGPREIREMSLKNLFIEAKRCRRDKEKKKYYMALNELNKKFSVPAASFVFVFLGIALGSTTRSFGGPRAFSISLAIILIYYILLSAGEAASLRGFVNPIIAIWSPNIFFGALGLYIFYKETKR